MTESFSLFTPTQVTSAALLWSAASASDASEDASAERYFTPTRGILEPPQGLAQGVCQALLGVRDERATLLGSREPVDYLPAAARVAGFWNAPDDTLARRRRMGRARLSVVLLLIYLRTPWRSASTGNTGEPRRAFFDGGGVFPVHIRTD